jgi:hypothetical protein
MNKTENTYKSSARPDRQEKGFPEFCGKDWPATNAGPRAGSENFDLSRDDRQVCGFHDCLLGQLLA